MRVWVRAQVWLAAQLMALRLRWMVAASLPRAPVRVRVCDQVWARPLQAAVPNMGLRASRLLSMAAKLLALALEGIALHPLLGVVDYKAKYCAASLRLNLRTMLATLRS